MSEEMDHYGRFKLSGLAKAYYKGFGHISKTLRPQFNVSGTSFVDLYYDPKTGKARQRPTQCSIGFSVMEAKNIDTAISGCTIEGRHVRIALFDGTEPLSNVHSLPAVRAPDTDATWRFSTKASLLFPKDDDNTCFLKTTHIDLNLCLLFELCLTVTVDGSSDLLELCVGWGMLPLFTSDGGPIENKSYEVKLYPGNPFSTQSRVENMNEKSGFFQTLIYGKQSPRLQIRVWKLGKSALDEMNQLPDTMISFLSAVPVMAFYRLVLAETLARDNRLGAFYDPTLALFPQIADQNDLLQLFVLLWERKLRSLLSRSTKSLEVLKKKFHDCILIVWPLTKLHEFPTYIEGHDRIRTARQAHINIIQEMGILDLLSSGKSSYSMKPFHSEELTFSFP
ncbi:hypothetical protein DFJ73DRAFT_579206 [Zopfochytrium polystomum]|nr:hypothetical protein DFJ73DRAFT_579206 [Zopfochytrium polystomum]